MESVGLDMEDIFETGGDLDEDIPVPPPMPDLEDEGPLNENGTGSNGEEDGEGGDVLAKLKDISKGAAKKRVMRPQPKLDIERLRSKRGLAVLPTMFKEVKFKGQGHEAEDLGLLMGKLEHWAHRLFPKVPFDDFIERLEKLGGKKPVQTCIKRIRLDMAINEEDYVQRGEDVQDEDKPEAGPSDVVDMDAEEAYEEMMRQERERMEQEKRKRDENARTPPSGSQNITPLPVNSPKRGQSSQSSPTPSTSAVSNGASVRVGSSEPTTRDSSPGGLTAEQTARMERNRRLAMERRMAKLGRTPTTHSPITKNQVSNEAGNQKVVQGKDDIGQTTHELGSKDESLHLHLTESELTSSASQQPHTPLANSQSGDSNRSSQTLSEQLNLKLDATESLTDASVNSANIEGLRLQVTETEVEREQSHTEHCEEKTGDIAMETDTNTAAPSTEPEREFKLKLSVTDDEGGMETDSE